MLGTTRNLSWVIVAGLLFAPAGAALAQDISYSPDITLQVSSFLIGDQDVVGDAAGANQPLELGAIPDNVDLVAYHEIDGKSYFVVDIATELPGGVYADGRDVVLYSGGVYEVIFDGSQKGVPAGVEIDALSSDGADLIFSFDIDTEIGGFFAADEDLVLFDGAYQLIFDGSGVGVPTALDIDAVSRLADGSELVLSFDTGGEIDAIEFFDQDALLYLGGASFDLEIKGANLEPGLVAGDLDALMIAQMVDLGEIFSDGFESGNTGAWSSVFP